ncbi:MAG: hypothetical protein J4F30_08335, partial [Acidobacteria bacterium]|nr:hypothetical protein [Acidobacteriota bacterium]
MNSPALQRAIRIAAVLVATTALATAAPAAQPAGETAPPAQPGAQQERMFGPPPPAPPATIARDAANQATLRAVRLTAPLDIDGELDEQVYRDLSPASDFIQI